jgi:electron transfer flavoprotein alpha subunit
MASNVSKSWLDSCEVLSGPHACRARTGGCRPPVQIGLTGKVVTPELYFAIAISGASQHLAGCLGAKTIVAINRDPEANIFNVAHFGAVGDWQQILPSFIEKVKEFKSK